MKKETAQQIQRCALEAIQNLNRILSIAESDSGEYAEIKKSVGFCIGGIQMNILEVINRQYPELDDLK